LSGAAGLLLQTLWVQRLGFTFGNTVVSANLVLGSFFFGMALGSRFFGKRADRSASPFRFYAFLELGIGLAAIAIWFALSALEPFYVQIYRASGGNLTTTYIIQLVLTFVVLSLPTILMGATLPAMVRCATHDANRIAISVGGVYSLNAAGAALGLIAGAFVLIELYGLRGCYAIAISLNLASAILAALAARRSALAQPSTVVVAEEHSVPRWMYALAFGTGAIGIGYEVLWIRLWAFVSLHSVENQVGHAPAEMSSTYVFSFIVFLVIAGIALGGTLVRFLHRADRSHLEGFAIVQAAMGMWGIAGVTIERVLTFDSLTAKLLEMTLVIFPMALLMGLSFPLLAAAFVRNLEESGDRFGRFYSANTLGSCAGPILAGLVLLPTRGTYPSLTLFAVTNLVAAAILVAVARGKQVRRTIAIGTAIFLIVLIAPLPRMTVFTGPDAPKVIFEEDNSVAHTLVLDGGNGSRSLIVNNHAVSGVNPAHAFGRASIQIPTAFLGRVPKDILVLCVGTGGSLAATLRYDANVVAVDINPAVFRAMPLLHPPDRYRRLTSDRVHRVVGDARNFLLLDERKYDVINIDPAPPITQPGMVNLHTVEFYRLAKARLKPGGILIQRLSGGPDSEAFYPELLRALADVFPEVTVWSFLSRGVDVIASEKPLHVFHDHPALIDADIARVAPRTFLFARPELEQYVARATAVTDDRPSLEFNILSRWNEDRFESARLRNLEELQAARVPMERYVTTER
jgi:predicted membrane-bound spermidine synthase